jgi:hypothetical protein
LYCEEYPNMARPKSPAGSKKNLKNSEKEQVGVGVPNSGTEIQASEVKSVVPESAGRTVAAEATPVAKTSPAEAKPEPRKLEVVKNGSRRNLVPINLDDEIRQRAYELYEQRGAAGGNEADDWFNAEREIRERYHQRSA